MRSQTLALDEKAKQMQGESLPQKRLAYVISTSPCLDRLVEEFYPNLQEEEDAIAYVLSDFYWTPPRDRVPETLPDRAKELIGGLVHTYLSSPDTLLSKAFRESKPLFLHSCKAVPGLNKLVRRRRSEKFPSFSFQTVTKILGLEIERSRVPSLAAAKRAAEAVLNRLKQESWNESLSNECFEVTRSFEAILDHLFEFYVRALPESIADWKKLVPVKSWELGRKIKQLRNAELAIKGRWDPSYKELFGPSFSVVCLDPLWNSLQVIVFFRNAVVHVIDTTQLGRLLRIPCQEVLQYLISQVDPQEEPLFSNLTPKSGVGVISDSQFRALARVGCAEILRFYNAIDERYPKGQFHKGWDEGTLRYKDEAGRLRAAEGVNTPSPFLERDVYAQVLPDDRLIWLPVDGDERPIVTKVETQVGLTVAASGYLLPGQRNAGQ